MKNLSHAAYGILVTLVALGLSLVVTYPLAIHLTDQLIGVGGDTYQYLGFQSLTKLQLLAGKFPFSWTTLWRYPIGFDFGRGYDSVLSNTVGALLSMITNNPTLAYNLTILGSLVFNQVAGYYFFLQLSKSKKIALLGMIAFGLSFYNLARATGHANLLLTGGFALLATASLKLWESSAARTTVGTYLPLFLALTVLGLSSAQYFIVGCICLAISVLVAAMTDFKQLRLVIHHTWIDRFKVAIAAIPAIVMIWVIFVPIFLAILEGNFAWKTDSDYSPHLVDFILPNPAITTLGNTLSPISFDQRNVEHVVFLGWVEWLGLIASLFFLIFGKKHTRIAFPLTFFLIMFCFSLGIKNPETGAALPYSALMRVYPFAAVSEPGRYIIIANLFLLSLIALALKNIRLTNTVWLLVALGLILERVSPGGYPLTPAVGGEYTQAVRKLPGSAVMDIPVSDARHNINPELYQKSIISGYMHWLGDTWSTRAFLLENNQIGNFECSGDLSTNEYMRFIATSDLHTDNLATDQEMLARLKKNDIRTIVLHKDYQYFWPGCSNVVARWTNLFPATMLVKPTGSREQTMHARWSGQNRQKLSLFFARPGTFRISSINFSPKVSASTLKISLGGTAISAETWKFSPDAQIDYSIWMSPVDNDMSFNVSAGSVLTFATDNYQESGFATVTYTYEVQLDGAPQPLIINGLQKVYEDEKAEVYFIL